MYYLYTITNTADSSVYVGITNDINRRFREHKLGSSNKYLRIAQELFDKSFFNYSVQCIGSKEYISDLEIKTIEFYRIIGTNVYNVSKGGLTGNGSPGEEHWNSVLNDQDILYIRNVYATNKITQRKLAEKFGIGYKSISKVVRGERWTHVGGSITLEKQEVSKVANRRKLSDLEVVEIRKLTKEEYLSTGSIDIPDISLVAGISRQSMRLLLKGISYKKLSGPILGKDYYKEFGR